MQIEEASIEILENLLKISSESIKTIEYQTQELKKEDPFIIAPPEDIQKICNNINIINKTKRDIMAGMKADRTFENEKN